MHARSGAVFLDSLADYDCTLALVLGLPSLFVLLLLLLFIIIIIIIFYCWFVLCNIVEAKIWDLEVRLYTNGSRVHGCIMYLTASIVGNSQQG